MLIWKLIASAEAILIILLVCVIIQKAKYDMTLQDYEDFDATIIERNWKYAGIGSDKEYYVTVKYKFGSMTIFNKSYFNGFHNNEKVTVRIRVQRNNNGDVIRVLESKALLLRTNVG